MHMSNLKLKRVLMISLIVLGVIGCLLLSYLAATGAWGWTVTTIESLITQGPAAIISAILAVLFSYYCLIPLVIIAIYLIFVYFVYIR